MLVVVHCAVFRADPLLAEAAPSETGFQFIERYCVDCHDGPDAKGGT